MVFRVRWNQTTTSQAPHLRLNHSHAKVVAAGQPNAGLGKLSAAGATALTSLVNQSGIK